ncbi:hypothetical protein HK096_000189, partial [Nowakowskiella sp. JEL0078]
AGIDGVEWEVYVIDNPQKNAFVLPGGKIFVFTGILPIVETEDGLAAVLGHEKGILTEPLVATCVVVDASLVVVVVVIVAVEAALLVVVVLDPEHLKTLGPEIVYDAKCWHMHQGTKQSMDWLIPNHSNLCTFHVKLSTG